MGVTVKILFNHFDNLALETKARVSTAIDMTAVGMKQDAQQASPQQLNIDRKWRLVRQGNFKTIVRNTEWRAVFYENGTPFLPQLAMLANAVERQIPLFEERLKLALEK